MVLLRSDSINDYFVWSGAVTDTDLTLEGKLYPGRLYKYIGPVRTWKWEQDTDVAHNNVAMSDILGIAGADLEQNNSQENVSYGSLFHGRAAHKKCGDTEHADL